MSARFTIIGDGAMGTACSLLLGADPGHQVTIWCQFAENQERMSAERENAKFLPGVKIPDSVRITADFAEARDADVFVVAVPTLYLADTLGRLAGDWPENAPVVSVVKGMEQDSFRSPTRMSRSPR